MKKNTMCLNVEKITIFPIKLEGEINAEMLKHLMTELKAHLESEQEHALVFLTSSGGDIPIAREITLLLDRHAKDLTLIASGWNVSAAIEILALCQREKCALLNSSGMYHTNRQPIWLNANGVPIDTEEQFKLDSLKESKVITLDVCKRLNLTEDETSRILDKGEDVYFTPLRFAQIFESLAA